MRDFRLILLIGLVVSSTSFSQSKKELMDKVARQEKTIDSLKKVVANFENIVENRDRTVKIAKEDKAEAIQLYEDEKQLRLKQQAALAKMRKNNATGKAKILTMNNNRSTFKVKEGKYWILNQFMADYAASITKDSTGAVITEEIHIFLKSVDDQVLTDAANMKYGPKLYSSLHPEQTIRYPIVLTENIKFSIIVFRGKIGALYPHDADVYCSYTEKDL